jgi:hypothetical protein
MEKLEHYLDQVCRSIGGPRALRQHVRQELREHLLDAAAQYKAAGLPEEEALSRALEDFGGSEQLRSELEATHGHRLWPVVIDKAMQWKERTMKAKWLWTTWAYLAAVVVIVLQVFFITFNGLYILPKFEKLSRDGIFDVTMLEKDGISWMFRFLHSLSFLVHHTVRILLGAATAWGLLEWRVKSENKPFIRLSVLGTTSVVLTVVVILMSGSLVVLFCLVTPRLGQMSRPWAIEQIMSLDASLAAVEQALAKKDWAAMPEQVEEASKALYRLSDGPALSALARRRPETPTVEELRSHVEAASEDLARLRQAIRDKDEERMKTTLRQIRQWCETLREAAKTGSKSDKRR